MHCYRGELNDVFLTVLCAGCMTLQGLKELLGARFHALMCLEELDGCTSSKDLESKDSELIPSTGHTTQALGNWRQRLEMNLSGLEEMLIMYCSVIAKTKDIKV